MPDDTLAKLYELQQAGVKISGLPDKLEARIKENISRTGYKPTIR